MPKKQINVYLVAGGIFHDTDFARLELLKLFSENDRFVVQVAQDYSDIETIVASDFLVTYTCNIIPTLEQQKALIDFVKSGKRWFALHGTNTTLKFVGDKIDTTDQQPLLNSALGSNFMAHTLIHPFTVNVRAPEHPLMKNIKAFETSDELYFMNTADDVEVLLDTKCGGAANPLFIAGTFPTKDWPLMYTRKLGKGEIVYLALGHCNGHYENPLQDYVIDVERCSWESPVFYELLRRGIAWCARD